MFINFGKDSSQIRDFRQITVFILDTRTVFLFLYDKQKDDSVSHWPNTVRRSLWPGSIVLVHQWTYMYVIVWTKVRHIRQRVVSPNVQVSVRLRVRKTVHVHMWRKTDHRLMVNVFSVQLTTYAFCTFYFADAAEIINENYYIQYLMLFWRFCYHCKVSGSHHISNNSLPYLAKQFFVLLYG